MRNKLTMFLVGILLCSISFASHSVSGYYRKDGTYVEPHRSMDPGEARSSGYSYHNDELVPYKERNE